MKRVSGIHCVHCWLSLCLFCSGLLAACGPTAEQYARQTLVAMTESAQTAAIPQDGGTPVQPPAESTAGPVFSTQTIPETVTPWVWINDSTETPVVLTLPEYATFTATATPTTSLTPAKGPSPTRTRQPSATQTITATARPPSADLRIDTPGEGSKIVSPYEFQAAVARGEDGMVNISLIGEDGQEYYSEILDYRQSNFNRLLVTPTLTFEFPAVGENARLVLYTYDLQERIMALASVDVVLLSIGSNQINPSQHPFDPFLIDSPRNGAELHGKRLIVSGRAVSLNENPILIELLDEDGVVIANREIVLDAPAPGETYTPFVTELEVDVNRQVDARLVIRQESANSIPGNIALSSAAITLQP